VILRTIKGAGVKKPKSLGDDHNDDDEVVIMTLPAGDDVNARAAYDTYAEMTAQVTALELEIAGETDQERRACLRLLLEAKVDEANAFGDSHGYVIKYMDNIVE
jgi:hypothetical protein